jgi:endonuclease IV
MMMRKRLKNYQLERISFCYDTCHAFVSSKVNGIDYNPLRELRVFSKYKIPVCIFHLNNSKSLSLDRHSPIFRPVQEDILYTCLIPDKDINLLIRCAKKNSIPMILEQSFEVKLEQYKNNWKDKRDILYSKVWNSEIKYIEGVWYKKKSK